MSEINLFKTKLQFELKKLTEISDLWKKELGSCLPEHANGLIRSAIGKAQLLINGKFKQFGRLIDVNTNGSEENVVTASDLEGFWDLVSLEIADVDNMFLRLTKLKANGWAEAEQQMCEVKRAPLKVKNVKPRVETSDEHRLAAKERLEEIKKKMKSNSNEKDTKIFEVPIFFTIRSPPRECKGVINSKNKDSASVINSKNMASADASLKPVSVDFTPCMRVTRSMKKTLQSDGI